jgi:DNA-binding LytR/AlgR family response regulator
MTGGQQPPDGALRGFRILVVEDELLIAMELEALLHHLACEVIGPAASVRRALGLLDRERPDAGLLDLNLKGQPATPVAAELRARRVPFVLVTGYGAALASAPELRDAPRVSKPISHQELHSTLARLLQPSGA